MAAEALKTLNLSDEEMSRMTTCMKDPKFLELLNEYMTEISEPGSKEEAEAYIKLVEDRQSFSMEGKELIVPSAGFCLKTKDKKTGRKVFINVCHTRSIDKPCSITAAGKGQEWSIPYSLGPARKEYDKARTECEVHDFVVNEEAYERASKNKRFKRFLAQVALENISKQRHVDLDHAYVFPKMAYKGATKNPKLLTVRKKNTENADQASSSKPATPARTTPPSTATEDNIDILPPKEVEPCYEFIYRDHLDMSQFWEHQAVANLDSQKPKAVILRVSLPDVATAGEVELDVSGTEVTLHVPGKYRLKANTRYPVDFENGKAQFDKSKRKLEVIMPTS